MDALEEKGVDYELVEYMKTPLDRKTIEKLVELVGGDPVDMLRVEDKKFAATGLDPKKAYTAKEVVDILVKHGEVMQRPIVVKGKRAIIARPGEKVLEIL